MEKERFENEDIRMDYHDLLIAANEMLERFKDYTPDRQAELDSILANACENSEDIHNGKEIFQTVRNYIIFRYNELNEFRARREKAEKEFMEALPEIFDQLAVPCENSCKMMADFYEKYEKRNNYQVLVSELLRLIAEM